MKILDAPPLKSAVIHLDNFNVDRVVGPSYPKLSFIRSVILSEGERNACLTRNFDRAAVEGPSDFTESSRGSGQLDAPKSGVPARLEHAVTAAELSRTATKVLRLRSGPASLAKNLNRLAPLRMTENFFASRHLDNVNVDRVVGPSYLKLSFIRSVILSEGERNACLTRNFDRAAVEGPSDFTESSRGSGQLDAPKSGVPARLEHAVTAAELSRTATKVLRLRSGPASLAKNLNRLAPLRMTENFFAARHTNFGRPE